MLNIINRVSLHLHFANEEQAFRIRQQFADSIAGSLSQIIDEECAQYLPDSQILKLHQLHVNVGRLNGYTTLQQFADVFRYRFRLELIKKSANQNQTEPQLVFALSKLEILEYFLTYGALPWYAPESEVDLQELTSTVLAGQPTNLYQFLLANTTQPQIWKRISYQLGRQAHAAIIQHFVELERAVDTATSLLIIARQHVADPGTLEFETQLQAIGKMVIEEAVHVLANPANENTVRKLIAKHIDKITTGSSTSTTFLNEFQQKNELVDAETHLSLNELNYTNVTNPFDDNSVITDEQYKVANAGLLLLSPFLQVFFGRLLLMEKGEWTSTAAQEKAIYLLRYLTTGSTVSPEYALVLEKIFCGYSIAFAIEPVTDFTDKELSECDELLLSAIEHWKVLKNTSIAGLRQAFLQREGIVSRTADGFLIRVERKTHDVLLDSIPWGYSTIAFNWLPQLITVEW